MGMKFHGFREVAADIHQLGERTTRASRRQVEIEAEKIKDLSVANAPVDLHNLEQAHEVVKQDDGRRKKMVVQVGGVVNGRDTDEYALQMHEGSYQLGPKSREKQAATGRNVGAKYLERAYDEREEEMLANMTRAVRDLK